MFQGWLVTVSGPGTQARTGVPFIFRAPHPVLNPRGDLWFNSPIICDLEIGSLGMVSFLACFPGWKSHPWCLDPGVWQCGYCHKEVKHAHH